MRLQKKMCVKKNPTGVRPTEPSLYISTQTTIPVLTQIMTGFSVGALAIAASAPDKWSVDTIFLFNLTVRDWAFILFGISALSFLFTTEACVKSQSWDYFILSQERRDFNNTSDLKAYVEYCIVKSRLWHKTAVWAYRLGIMAIMLGLAVLFRHISLFISVIFVLYLIGTGVVFFIEKRITNENMRRI